MIRRASAGDLTQVPNSTQQGRGKTDQKQSTGCFGCLSKRNSPKCDDETLNNMKDKEEIDRRCVTANNDAQRDEDSHVNNVNTNNSNNHHHHNTNNNNHHHHNNNNHHHHHHNIINNLDLINSYETAIINNIVDSNNEPTDSSNEPPVDLASRDARHPIISEAAAVSDSEKHLRPDSSLMRDNPTLKPDNTDQLTTDSGIDLISSPPYPLQGENIYDSVRHFNSRRSATRDVPSLLLGGKEDLENVEFHHKIGRDLIIEMDLENFDAIHFESYRIAQKLNFLRQKLKLHHIVIYQVMGAFNQISSQTFLNINDLYELAGKLYSTQHHQHHQHHHYHQQHHHHHRQQQQHHHHHHQYGNNASVTSESFSKTSTLLVAWLLHIYDLKGIGRVETFSCKVALSSICVGPLFEKLKYIFKDLNMDDGKKEGLKTYLQSVLSLPSSLSSRHSSNSTLMMSVDGSMDKFLDEMVRGEVPSCLGWLQILHNLIRAEQVVHTVECTCCHVVNFPGFLYKCLECPDYLMCQSCFWRGFISDGHSVQHKVKEIMTPKSVLDEPGRLQGTSRERGTGSHQGKIISDIPSSPLSSINGFFQPWANNTLSTTTTTTGNKISMISMDESLSGGRRRRVIPMTSDDDEHKLISRYVHRLKCTPHKTEPLDPVVERQNLVFELEAKNREIQKEIQRLKCHQMQQQRDRRSATLEQTELSDDQLDPTLLKEIRLLRQHQGDLEARIKGLQGSRRGLIQQLEGLMRKLKTQSSLSPSVCSPRSYCDSPAFTYPSSIPYAESTHHSLPLHQPHHQPIPPLHQPHHQPIPPPQQPHHQPIPPPQQAPQQQFLHQNYASTRFPHQPPFQGQKPHLLPQSSPKSPGLNPVNYSMGSEFHQAFAFPSPSNVQGFQSVGLRQDLLMATDKVTDAVSSLVLELNTEESSDSEQERARNTAALKSPAMRTNPASQTEFDAMHIKSTPVMNPRPGSTDESGDLRRGGSLRENDVIRGGKIVEKDHSTAGSRQGFLSEGELNMEANHKLHSRSLETEEEESTRKWEGPKRRWSNR